MQLSWVFLGYLVYALVPKVYPEELSSLASAPGFRILTAVLTVYFGLAVTVGLSLSPPQVALGLLTEGLLLGNLWKGIILGALLYSGYLGIIRGDHLYDEESTVFQAYKVFDMISAERLAEERATIRAIQKLDSSTRRLVLVLYELISGVVFLPVCLGIGIALGLVNTYYPIPEMLFVVGVVLNTLPGTRFTQFGTDLESRVVTNVVDSTRNWKGILMILASALGLGFSLSVMLGSVDVAAGVQTRSDAVPASLFFGTGKQHYPSIVSAVQFGASVAVVLTPFIYGLVGLLYWSRQLSRTPAFAKYWENKMYDLAQPRPLPSLATRPRSGLLLINVMLLTTSTYVWQSPADGPSFVLQACFFIIWYVLLLALVRSVRSSFGGDPQDIDDDGDLVLLAILGQAITIGLATGILNGSLLETLTAYPDDLPLVIAVFLVVLFGLIAGLSYIWELPEQLVERSREEQPVERNQEEQVEPDDDSDYWLVGYIAGLLLFYAAGAIGLVDLLDIGLYVVVLIYVVVMWYIDTNVLPEQRSDV